MKKDYSAVKFVVSEELGEWMNCLYLKRREGEPWRHQFIHHTQSDGVGGVTAILEQEGHEVSEQPRTREMPSLSFFQRLTLLKRFVALTKPVKISWKHQRRDIKGIPETFVLALFSAKQTKELHQVAKENQVSLNSWLFYQLDVACQEIILNNSSERKWVSPINIRAQKTKLYGNHSASIIVNFLRDHSSITSPARLHLEIKKYLKGNLHWGSYHYSNMAKFIGKRGTKVVAKKVKEVGTGVFSNLGTCPSQGVVINSLAVEQYDRRAVLAPSTQVLPIAAAAWQWGESLSLSLQLHPSLNLAPSFTQEVMQRWTQLLQASEKVCLEEHFWKDYEACPIEKIVISTKLSI